MKKSNFFSLISILGVLLSSSTGQAMGLDGEQEKKASSLKITSTQQINKNKHIFDFWALNELCVSAGSPQDIMNYLRQTTAVIFLPEFPIDKKGNEIKCQSYFIESKNLRKILSFRNSYAGAEPCVSGVSIKPENVSSYSLKKGYVYNTIWRAAENIWTIEGMTPQPFKIDISKDFKWTEIKISGD
ncbi:MAG: hypothetical protein H0X26_00780 [Alphaproteobacteria bacterium]|nr:hypothetical protein [Alphaproteobacteria bacterium]